MEDQYIKIILRLKLNAFSLFYYTNNYLEPCIRVNASKI